MGYFATNWCRISSSTVSWRCRDILPLSYHHVCGATVSHMLDFPWLGPIFHKAYRTLHILIAAHFLPKKKWNFIIFTPGITLHYHLYGNNLFLVTEISLPQPTCPGHLRQQLRFRHHRRQPRSPALVAADSHGLQHRVARLLAAQGSAAAASKTFRFLAVWLVEESPIFVETWCNL